MKIELHIIQNFAPSNLNRDDTNTPKDCEFGGVRRARISSQCIKRSIRTNEAFIKNIIKTENTGSDMTVGIRTRLVKDQIAQYLGIRLDKDQSKKLDELIKLTVNTQVNEKTNSTNMLIHYDDSEISSLARIFRKILDGTKIETAAKEFKPKSKASDIALFGRMLAENTDFNVDAACQVAHAISTHKVSMEMDFFTAIDDLKKDFSSGEAGAGMMGTIEFNSACFYRYSVIDTKQLENNLDGDKELTKKTIKAFIQSSIASIPSGKQNSMAAQNPPSFVMVVVKDGCPWSLANAFEVPITHGTEGIIANSIRRFDLYWGRLQSIYGSDGIVSAGFINLEQVITPNIDAFKVENKDQLIAKAIEAV